MARPRTSTDDGRRRAVVDRDAAIARVRRASTVTLAGAATLVAAFAGLAAASTHHARKVVRRVAVRRPAVTKVVKTPSVSPPPVTPSGTPTPAPPAQAPTPSVSPPAVVSGGT
jgi:hypothetical protein